MMAKRGLRGVEEAAWPIVTIKEYAKHVLGSCDRRWSLDVPFIAFLFDMLLKERLYSPPPPYEDSESTETRTIHSCAGCTE